LRATLIASNPSVQLCADGYVEDVQDNLLPGVALDGIQASLEAGAGHELESKIRAPHSSAALVVNAFGPWQASPELLRLGGRSGFGTLQFEAQVKVFPDTRATPAHLDLLADGPGSVVGVESKLLEIMSRPKPEFSRMYDRFLQDATSPWVWWIENLRREPDRFKWLDAAQLVKHALALRRQYAGRAVNLLYLYWEPRNAMSFEIFQEHRAEVEEFRRSVISDEHVVLRVERHGALWESWQKAKTPTWLAAHAEDLCRRYVIDLAR
jgi:hypothetical protein